MTKRKNAGEGEGAPVEDAEAKAAAEAAKAQKKAEAEAKKAQKAAEADAKKAERAAAAERAKAEKAAAAEAKKAEREAAKAAKAAEREANRMPEQNGVRRPKPATLCGKAWEIFDDISRKNGAPASISEAMEIGKARGLNEANMRAEYARWRKFYGISGRISAPKAEAPAEG